MATEWTIRSGEDLGRAVAGIRTAKGLTQAELAEQAGLDRTALVRLEQGKNTKALEHYLRLLRRLGATVTVTFEPPQERSTDADA